MYDNDGTIEELCICKKKRYRTINWVVILSKLIDLDQGYRYIYIYIYIYSSLPYPGESTTKGSHHTADVYITTAILPVCEP